LAALTPKFDAEARLAVLADAIAMVSAVWRDGKPGLVLPLDTILPDESDTAYWARVGMAAIIEAQSCSAQERAEQDPLLTM
jgi:hypothetical protein